MRKSIWENGRTKIEAILNKIKEILNDEKFVTSIQSINEEEKDIINSFSTIIIGELSDFIMPDNQKYKFLPSGITTNIYNTLNTLHQSVNSIRGHPTNTNNTTQQIQQIENHMFNIRLWMNQYSNISQNIEIELQNKNKKIKDLEKLLEQKNKGWASRLDKSNGEIETLISRIRNIEEEAKGLAEVSGTLYKTHNFEELAAENKRYANKCIKWFGGILIGLFVFTIVLLAYKIYYYFLASIPISGFLIYLSILEKRYRGKYFKYKDLATSINALPPYLSNISEEDSINDKDKLKLKMAEFFFSRIHNDSKFKEKDLVDLVDSVRGKK